MTHSLIMAKYLPNAYLSGTINFWETVTIIVFYLMYGQTFTHSATRQSCTKRPCWNISSALLPRWSTHSSLFSGDRQQIVPKSSVFSGFDTPGCVVSLLCYIMPCIQKGLNVLQRHRLVLQDAFTYYTANIQWISVMPSPIFVGDIV